jgi:predicted regulator of Ras-like GTPase activity (Roadblock/LC7/MglB family)
MIIEYEQGTLLLHGIGPSALLALLVSDPATLGKVRYSIKKLLPELQRAL